MDITTDNPPTQQSLFVTVLAWVFIVLAGLGAVSAILQNIMMYVMFSPEMIHQMMQAQGQNAPPMPPFIFTIVRLVMFAGLLLFVFGLAASIGLLKRKN